MVCFEGVSELAATEIEEEPLAGTGRRRVRATRIFRNPGSLRRLELDDADVNVVAHGLRRAAGGLRQGQRASVCVDERSGIPSRRR